VQRYRGALKYAAEEYRADHMILRAPRLAAAAEVHFQVLQPPGRRPAKPRASRLRLQPPSLGGRHDTEFVAMGLTAVDGLADCGATEDVMTRNLSPWG
jgi:hypothetical protein